MKVKEMWKHYQPDVPFDTRYGRYYRTGDPSYVPNTNLYLKNLCPANMPLGTFKMRVSRRWLEKAINTPYNWRFRHKIKKV